MTGLNGCHTIALVGDTLYFTELGLSTNDGAVKKVSTNGGTVTTCASGRFEPRGLYADSSVLVWGEENVPYRMNVTDCK